MKRSKPALLAWVGFALAAAIVYWPVATKLATDWWTDGEYSHGLICAPLAVAIAVARRRIWAEIPPAPSGAGLAGAIAAVGLLLLGTLGAELFLTRISLCSSSRRRSSFFTDGATSAWVTFPLALVALSVPIPRSLDARVTLPLQFAASGVAETALNIVRIPVLREGGILVLSNRAAGR